MRQAILAYEGEAHAEAIDEKGGRTAEDPAVLLRPLGGSSPRHQRELILFNE